jgi:hypothetical protein
VARTLGGAWRLRAEPGLRQWRQPESVAAPDLRTSTNLAGHTSHAGMRYLHASADQVVLHAVATSATTQPELPAWPYLIDANADINRFEPLPGGGWLLQLAGHVPAQARLALPDGWRLVAEPGAQVRRDAGQVRVTNTKPGLALRLLPQA